MKLQKTYKIETERLIIRCYEPKDAQMFKNAIDISLEHLLSWMPWAKNEPEGLETKIERLRQFHGQFDLGQDYIFGIFDKTEKELIGSTGLHTRIGENAREIGYWINIKHINKGYASEATSALTKIGFEIEQLQRIEIHCNPENERSRKIPEKLGYKLELIQKDKMIWTMLQADYEKNEIRKMKLKAFDIVGREIGLAR